MAELFNSETPEEKNAPEQEAHQETPQPESSGDQSVLFKVGDREYDAAAAAKKIQSADEFIEQLKQEKREVEARLKQLEQEAKGSQRFEEALELLRSKQQAQQDQSAPSEETPTVDQGLDIEKLRQLVREEFSSTKQQDSFKQNMEQSIKAVKERYGDSYQDKLLQRGQELGLSTQRIEQMAAQEPALFKELFIGKGSNPAPAPASSHNSRAVTSNQPTETPRVGKHWDSKSRVEALRRAEAQLLEEYKAGKLSLD